MDLLKGRKTYLLAVCGALVVFLKLSGLIDSSTADTLLILLGFGTGAALRASK